MPLCSHIRDLAHAIADAHARHEVIPPPATTLTLMDGYAVQAEVSRRVGGAVAAYKVGLTSPAAQQAMGTREPIVGRLRAADILHGNAVVPSGARLRFAEAELVVEIGRDLPPSNAPYDRDRVAAAVSAVHAGIELCSSRYAAEDVDIGALVADNSNAEWLVVGDRLSTRWEDRFAALDAILLRDGMPPVRGSTAAVMGDPLAALTWLANWLTARGEMLRQGQFVATGSCTGITEIARETRLSSRFADGGEAHVRIGDPADQGEEKE